MKQISNFIVEKLIINKNIKIENPKNNDLGLTIEYKGKEYNNSMGDNLPIDDYAESAEEAYTMIERDTTKNDKLYILKKLDNGNYKHIYDSLDYFYKQYIDGNRLMKCDKSNTIHNKTTIKDIYNQGYIIVKVKG